MRFCFCGLAFRDVTCNLGSADNLSLTVLHRRDGQGNVNSSSFFSDSHRFEMIHTFTARDSLEDVRLLGLAIGVNEHPHRFAQDFLLRIPEQPFSARIPTDYDTV